MPFAFAAPKISSAAQAKLNQGDYFKQRGANKEAEKFYREAVNMAPQSYLPHKSLAFVLAAQNLLPESFAEINTAIKMAPDEVKLYVDRGAMYMTANDKKLAEADFKKALASPLCGHAVYKFLEDLYQSQGRIKEAAGVCDIQIQREPSDLTYHNKARFLSIIKDYAGAREALTKAIGYAPYNYGNFAARGDAWLAEGNAKEAVADYSQALSLDPYFPSPIYQSRARAYGMLGRKDLAQKDLEASKAKY